MLADCLPTLLLTGASGIVGRAFLEAAEDRLQSYAIARRSQTASRVAHDPNVRWNQVDIANLSALCSSFWARMP